MDAKTLSLFLAILWISQTQAQTAETLERDIFHTKISGTAEEIQVFRKVFDGGQDIEKTPEWEKATRSCAKETSPSVSCILESLLGSHKASELVLSAAKKTGYVFSLIPDAGSSQQIKQWSEIFWTEQDLSELDAMLSEMPTQFHHLPTLQVFIKGYSDPESGQFQGLAFRPVKVAGRIIPGGIFLQMPSMERMLEGWGDREVKRLFAHELSHHYAYTHIEMRKAFDRLSAWKFQRGQWSHGSSSRFVSDYAATNPYEDFAESTSFYRYFPDQLKAASPSKYEFLRSKVFLGKEYLSEGIARLHP